MRARTVRVLRHIAPEGPGRIASALSQAGLDVSITRIDLGEAVPRDLDDTAGLVVMGGPMGVYEADRFPHLAEEQKLIERALASEIPVLGVCLGSQLLAATLGARVYPGPRKEIGWFPVAKEPAAGDDALFADLPDRFTALHWHGDVFDLPDGAVALARSELTRHQAFRFGRNAYGLLFHLEAAADQVTAMASLFAGELTAAGVNGGELVAATPEAVEAAAPHGTTLFGAWARLALA